MNIPVYRQHVELSPPFATGLLYFFFGESRRFRVLTYRVAASELHSTLRLLFLPPYRAFMFGARISSHLLTQINNNLTTDIFT